MSATKTHQQALSFLNTLEKAGKSVSRVTIDGRKIMVDLAKPEAPDEFDEVEMRYDQA